MQMDIQERAEYYLSIAEDVFGPRVNEWKFYGVEITEGSTNPHIKYYPESGEIAISLTPKIIDGINLSYQLAHEIAHLLHPSMNYYTHEMDQTIVINEGISVFFSELILSMEYEISPEDRIEALKMNLSSSYQEAYAFVYHIIKKDREIIKKLRSIQPLINRITVNEILSVNPEIELAVAQKLVEPFMNSK